MRLTGSLTLLLLLLISCATVPRDDTELLEKGVQAYRAGEWQKAEILLSPYRKRIPDRPELALMLSACAYRNGDPLRALDHIQSLDLPWYNHPEARIMLVPARYQSRDAEPARDRLSFLEFVRDVAERYAVDPGLLLAFMRQESTFVADAISRTGAVGLMQLMPETARALGLTVPAENNVYDPPILDSQKDERFLPARNIEAAAAHIDFLINNYRFGNKSSNLRKAIAAYYTGTGNVRDTIPEYCSHYVNRVSDYYRHYRYNLQHQEEASDFFHQRNDSHDFTRETARLDQTRIRIEFEQLTADVSPLLKRASGEDRAVMLNNLAVLADAAGLSGASDSLYQASLDTAPDLAIARLNYGLFLFNEGRYHTALLMLEKLEDHPRYGLESGIARAEIGLLIGDDQTGILLDRLRYRYPDNPMLQNLTGVWLSLHDQEHLALSFLRNAWAQTKDPVVGSNFLVTLYRAWLDHSGEQRYTRLKPTDYIRQSPFIWPVEQREISSRFGWRPGPVYRNWTKRLENLDRHNGIDIPAPTGTPVHAAADGDVLWSGCTDISGNVIVVQHDNGYLTSYVHLHDRYSKTGDKLRQGDVLGTVGSTGKSTGPHLHFGIKNSEGEWVNPLHLLPSD